MTAPVQTRLPRPLARDTQTASDRGPRLTAWPHHRGEDETGQELLEEALRVLAPDVVGLERRLPASTCPSTRGVGHKSGRPRGRGRYPGGGSRAEGGHRHARGAGRRRQPEQDPARGDRRPRHRAHRTAHPRRRADRRRAPADLGRAHGGRRCLRRQGWREGDGEDEVAFRTMKIERRICRAVAEFSFRHAERTRAKVFGGRSTPSAPCTRACSRRRWTRPPSGIPTSSTSRSSSTRRSRSSSAPRARHSSSRR